jgi:hypothetical protein
MIKRLTKDTDPSDTVTPPKTVDGLQFDASDDDTFYQGNTQGTVPTTPAATPATPVSTTMTATAPTPSDSAAPTSTVDMTASSRYAAVNLGTSSSQSALDAIPNNDPNIPLRKMALEEAKFQLDQEKTRHAMFMELKKEDFRQQQLREEEERNNKKSAEPWMKAFWRPAMGWLYMLICAFDFIIAPILTMTMPVYLKMLGAAQISYMQWQSLTLSNGGLIHLAFGAILGVAAWTRGQEKLSKMG